MDRHRLKSLSHSFTLDAVVHASSLAQARQVLEAIQQRLAQCGLELHPEKTKIVYCQDSDRSARHDHVMFDFLGYTFAPRRAKNRWGNGELTMTGLVRHGKGGTRRNG